MYTTQWYEEIPNPGLPSRFFEKSVYIHQQNRFEQKILGRNKIRPIFLISTIPGHLKVAKHASEYIL